MMPLPLWTKKSERKVLTNEQMFDIMRIVLANSSFEIKMGEKSPLPSHAVK